MPKPPCLPPCLPLPSGNPQPAGGPRSRAPTGAPAAPAEANAPPGPAQLPSQAVGPQPRQPCWRGPHAPTALGVLGREHVRGGWCVQKWLRAKLPPSCSLAAPPQQGKMGKEDEEAHGSYKGREIAHLLPSWAKQVQLGEKLIFH